MNNKKKTGKTNSGPLHRGRIQAQGAKLEESVAWSSEQAPTGSDGRDMLVILAGKITSREALMRNAAFQEAEDFIHEAVNAGGAYADKRKTFMVRNTLSERVDLEIRRGHAFKEAGDL
ncbi:hypothetical protein AB2B46_11430 [Kluyvera intermedia]|uniref:hypothetical protein n=1 Tax=Kluyvera intermedia TaxID=61648 RepID=UPI0034A1CDA3